MKSLGALLLLGAANYVAADYQELRPGGHVDLGTRTNGQTKKLIKDSNGNLRVENFPDDDKLRIVCLKASQVVDIWDNVGEMVKAFQHQIQPLTLSEPQDDVRNTGGQPDATAFSGDSVLVYACKVEKETDTGIWNPQPISTATNEANGVTSSVAIQGPFVRVHYPGKCTEPISKTTFHSQMQTGQETYAGGQEYTAPLYLEATTPCIYPVGFQKQIQFDLQYDPTSEAETAGITEDAVTTGEVYFTQDNRDSDGKTYTMTHNVPFDLGAKKPHPDYYESGVVDCISSGDEDLCKGGLKSTLVLSHGVSKVHSVATALVDYQTQGTGFKFKPCSHKTGSALDGTKEYDYLEACYGESIRDKVKAWTSATNSARYELARQVAADILTYRDSSDTAAGESGSGSLLTDMICPFTCKDRTSASCPLTTDNTADSTDASALKCLSVGVKHTVKLDDGSSVLHSPNFWDNRCAARTEGLTDPSAELTAVLTGTEADEPLRTPYNFTHKFTRGTGNQKQFVDPAKVTFDTYTIDLHSDVVRHDVTMTLSTGTTFTDLINKAAFFTVEGNSFVQEVTLNTNTIIVYDVPTYVKTLTLKGQVFKTCDRVKVDLSNAMTIEITKPLLTSGIFQPVGYDATTKSGHNPCNPLFEYVRTTNADNTPGAGQNMNYTVSGVLRGESLEEDPSLVKMCDEDPNVATGTSCARGGFHSSIVKLVSDNKGWETPVALLEGLCSVGGFPRKAGVIGALIAFSGQRAYAPVICPGTCRESTIHDVSLDWEIDIAVSATDNPAGPTKKSDHNKLIVRQETSNWGDTDVDTAETPNRYYDLERVAYLVPATTDDCQADGTLSIDDDSIPTNSVAKHATDSPGCLVYKQTRPRLNASAPWETPQEYEGIEKAADMVAWFKACGSQTALGAEVNLIQRFKVTYGDERDISFCQTKRLSVTVQSNMTGESTQVLTTVQQEDSSDSASIEAVLNQVQYTEDGCDIDGTFRLQAVTDVTTDVDITADWSQSPFFFRSGNTKWVAPTGSSNKGQFIWSTECAALCGSAQSLLTNFSDPNTLVVALSDSAGSEARLDVQFTINMEGSPCDGFSEVNKASAELLLYNAGEKDSNPATDHCETAFSASTKDDKPRALSDMVCGRLSVTNLGDSSLYITRTKLTRQLPDGSAAELLCEAATGETDAANGELCVGLARNVMFKSKETENTEVGFQEDADGTGEFIKFADSPIELFADDAFATLRYTIFWEQRLGGRRRLLRSDMILGAGVSTVAGDLVVLPISDQIEDTVESLEEGGQAASTNATDTEDDKDSGLGAGAIVAIVAASLAVVGGVGYFAVQAGGVDVPSMFGGKKRPKKDGYSVVRRSERFSTLNF